MSIPRAISSYFKHPQTMDQEILEFYEKNKQSKQERVAKLELTREMSEYLKENLNKNIQLLAVGSTVTKLGMCYSDLDLCLVIHPLMKYGDAKDSLQFLSQLQGVLKENYTRKCESIDIIPSKNVSIVRIKSITFKSITFDVDISVNNITGIRNSHLLHYYSSVDKRFCVLVILIKEWAANAGIADSRNGTFSGYCLALLVLHFLQAGVNPPVLPNLQMEYPQMFNTEVPVDDLKFFQNLPQIKIINKHTLSQLLLRFFDYYANQVDWKSEALSISSGEKKIRDQYESGFKRPAYIYIEELYNPLKNAAKRIYDLHRFEQIEIAFSEALNNLKQNPHISSIGIRD